jgi:hypothetical protein
MALISITGFLTFNFNNLSYQPVKVKMEIPLTLPSPPLGEEEGEGSQNTNSLILGAI